MEEIISTLIRARLFLSLLRTVNHFIDSITAIKLNSRRHVVPVQQQQLGGGGLEEAKHFPILHAIISSVTFFTSSTSRPGGNQRPSLCFS